MRKIIFCLFLFCSCSRTTTFYKRDFTIHKILKIDEYEYAYNLTTLNLASSDTNYVISYKKIFYDKYSIPSPLYKVSEKIKINIGDTLNIQSTKNLLRGNSQASSDIYVIVENDTIWKGDVKVLSKNLFHVSLNSEGLLFNKARN